MFGSFRLATIRGIPVRLHITLLASFGLFVVYFGFPLGLAAAVLLFSSVLVHELGHSVVAQRFGIPIASIDLHFLGGMALMTRPPVRPRDEGLIAVAGPLVSLVLGVTLSLIASATDAWPASYAAALTEPRHLLAYAAMGNLAMAAFNLLPALPMDGGRIFRAGLWWRLGKMRATQIAAWVSRGFALCFMVLGVTQSAFTLLALGGALLFMVSNEERIARAQENLRLREEDLGRRMALGEPVVLDIGVVPQPREENVTREEFIDPFGRRYVVVTKLVG